MTQQRIKRPVVFYGLLVLIVGYFTYFRNYHFPANLFWDENYHIAAAQKYLDRVMFMEPHPPTGKLLIALGEYLFAPNQGINTRPFLSVDHIKDIPKNYSFVGVRFFPSLLAWLSAVLFFLVLYQIGKNPHLAFLFSSLYLFENAFIVHFRGAMLEGMQVFFVLLALGYFLVLWGRERLRWSHYLVLGIFVGLATSVKLTSLLLLFLFPALFLVQPDNRQFGQEIKRFFRRGSSAQLAEMIGHLLVDLSLFLFGLVAVVTGSYYLHFYLGEKVIDDRHYQASAEYLALIDNQKPRTIKNFLIAYRDNLLFIPHYERGVPGYDPCKEGENGSPPYGWPIGKKSINYRWERDGGKTRYLYLQGNPVVWLAGLVAVVLSTSLVISNLVFKAKITHPNLYTLIKVVLVMYWTYLLVVAQLDRVLYLYHYFIPLLLSLLLFYLLVNYLGASILVENQKPFYLGVLVFVLAVIGTFHFFSPLTYYHPLSAAEFQARAWFEFWQLNP